MIKNLKFLSILISIIFLIVVSVTYIADLTTFGVANSSDVLEAMNKNKNDTITFEYDFLRIGNMPTIYKRTSSFFFKYQIIDVGGVYRWTKASDKIDSIYNSFKKTDRQKLGLDK